jgi:hypothetical protein
MSGIYIKGMEMPKSCPCELLGTGYDVCCSFAGGIPAHVKEYYECCQNDTRPSWCPLIPVPEHGRLIDADALGIRDAEKRAYEAYLMEKHEYFIEEPLLEYKRGLSEGLIHASGLVKFAPTIIPASKEGEG